MRVRAFFTTRAGERKSFGMTGSGKGLWKSTLTNTARGPNFDPDVQKPMHVLEQPWSCQVIYEAANVGSLRPSRDCTHDVNVRGRASQ
eukprot:6266054-Lingulodinium_polyedra.AAC.1